MEDSLRTTKKQSNYAKQNQGDVNVLFKDCHSNLSKLNQQLKGFLTQQRHKQFSCVLPSIDNLNKDIKELKEEIKYQPTVEEKIEERSGLFSNKQTLLDRIKGHQKQIENLNKKIQKLNINSDQLARQLEENKMAVEKYEEKGEDVEKMRITEVDCKSNRSSICSNYSKAGNKRSLPSLFGPQSQTARKSSFMPTIPPELQSKWSKIDRVLKKMSGLNSDCLASSLLHQAKRQKNVLKSLLKNYQIGSKMGQLLQTSQMRTEWQKLVSSIPAGP